MRYWVLEFYNVLLSCDFLFYLFLCFWGLIGVRSFEIFCFMKDFWSNNFLLVFGICRFYCKYILIWEINIKENIVCVFCFVNCYGIVF